MFLMKFARFHFSRYELFLRFPTVPRRTRLAVHNFFSRWCFAREFMASRQRAPAASLFLSFIHEIAAFLSLTQKFHNKDEKKCRSFAHQLLS